MKGLVNLDDLEFEFALREHDAPLLGPYVIGFVGKALWWDGKAARERVVGRIEGYRLDLASAAHDGVDRDLLLDSVCSEVSEFSTAVLNGQGCFFDATDEAGESRRIECSGLIYLTRLEVEAAFRGRQIGSVLMSKIGQMVDVKDCVIALKAFPLSVTPGEAAADGNLERVKRFYQRLGFSPVGDEFMAKQANQCKTVQKRIAWRREHPAQPILDGADDSPDISPGTPDAGEIRSRPGAALERKP